MGFACGYLHAQEVRRGFRHAHCHHWKNDHLHGGRHGMDLIGWRANQEEACFQLALWDPTILDEPKLCHSIAKEHLG